MIFTPYQEFLASQLLPMLAVCMAVIAQLEYLNHTAAYLGMLMMAVIHSYVCAPVNSLQQVSD